MIFTLIEVEKNLDQYGVIRDNQFIFEGRKFQCEAMIELKARGRKHGSCANIQCNSLINVIWYHINQHTYYCPDCAKALNKREPGDWRPAECKKG